MSKKSRIKFGKSIRERITSKQPSLAGIRNPIAFLEDLRPFTIASVKISILMSLVALAVILYIQYFLLGFDFTEIIDGVAEYRYRSFAYLFVFMVAANFVVDYVSFTQTLILIRLINRTDSKGSIFFIFITDLLASMSIFKFVYAFFLTIGLLHIYNPKGNLNFIVSITASEADDGTIEQLNDFNTHGFKNLNSIDIYPIGTDRSFERTSLFVLSQNVLSKDAVISILEKVVRREFPNDTPQLHNSKGFMSLGGKYPLELEYQAFGEMSYLANTGDPFIWYSISYLQANRVQDQFVEVATLVPGFQKIDELRTNAHAEQTARVSQFYYDSCGDDFFNVGDLPKDCDNGMTITSSDIGNLKVKLVDSIDVGGSMPLYTFLFTSLSLTFFVYIIYISFFVLSFLRFCAEKFSIPLSRFLNLEEYPVLIVTLPFSILAFIVYFYASVPSS